MLKTSASLLRLLWLLQSRRYWSGAELSERVEVDARTVRRDIDRLRELGYAVEASPGLGGGYQLKAGSSLPPVLLDDEEAVTVAVAVRAAASSIGKMEEAAIRQLAKSTGADSIEALAAQVVLTGADFDILEAPECVAEFREIAA
ncbi:MAG: HTH domain-containing protein [Gammaproteobacteria bacterium]|nr:MAG: HTH domain-containing protein [Gammaproteobacteria bacterium]